MTVTFSDLSGFTAMTEELEAEDVRDVMDAIFDKAAQIILKGVTSDKARVLVGFDAHAIHHFAKLAGSRYQDFVARASKRIAPPKL